MGHWQCEKNTKVISHHVGTLAALHRVALPAAAKRARLLHKSARGPTWGIKPWPCGCLWYVVDLEMRVCTKEGKRGTLWWTVRPYRRSGPPACILGPERVGRTVAKEEPGEHLSRTMLFRDFAIIIYIINASAKCRGEAPKRPDLPPNPTSMRRPAAILRYAGS